MTQTNVEYLQQKQQEFLHKVDIAEQYLNLVRSDLSPSARQLKRFPTIEQGLRNEIAGDALTRLVRPIPVIWDELGRRAADVGDPEKEYGFLQAVGTESLLYALQDTLLLVRAIQENADAIKAAIQYLNEAGKLPPEIGDQTLTEMNLLLSAINLPPKHQPTAKTPNAETLVAMRELEGGGGQVYQTTNGLSTNRPSSGGM